MSGKTLNQSPGTQSANVYQLKIALNYVKPAIWRRLLVPGDINLGFLHAAIQVAMGWTNSHLHQFKIQKRYYSDPTFELNEDLFDSPPVLDEENAILMEVVKREKQSFIYEYDFGDSWEHRITVEKILPAETSAKPFAECIGGSRACPPEDCGGVGGYEDLLKVIVDPEHEEYDSMMEWLGGGFDPEAFDQVKTNFYLRKLKWSHVTIDRLARVLMQRDGYKE